MNYCSTATTCPAATALLCCCPFPTDNCPHLPQLAHCFAAPLPHCRSPLSKCIAASRLYFHTALLPHGGNHCLRPQCLTDSPIAFASLYPCHHLLPHLPTVHPLFTHCNLISTALMPIVLATSLTPSPPKTLPTNRHPHIQHNICNIDVHTHAAVRTHTCTHIGVCLYVCTCMWGTMCYSIWQ